MNEKLSTEILNELLRNSGEYLYHREGQELEFKEQFSLAGLADYFRDFAAFANNRGGYLVFGIKNSPRIRTGLSEKSLEQFENIDPEKITGYLLEIFSCEVRWEQTVHEIDGGKFGVFYVFECQAKPVIAKKDEGKDNLIKNGEIYYRYGGRTQKIQFAELESIINKRIEKNNQQWVDLVDKIKKSGPANAAILDTKRGVIEKDDHQILVIDESLVKEMNFIKECEFDEVKGAPALKLVGEIQPIDKVEVIRMVKENLTKEYPLSAREMMDEVKKKVAGVKEQEVWDTLKDNGIRGDKRYSAFNFRSKKHEDGYAQHKILPTSTPCIYNQKCVDFVVSILRAKRVKGSGATKA